MNHLHLFLRRKRKKKKNRKKNEVDWEKKGKEFVDLNYSKVEREKSKRFGFDSLMKSGLKMKWMDVILGES